MKKLFISQPMKGKTNDNVHIIEKIKNVINSYKSQLFLFTGGSDNDIIHL